MNECLKFLCLERELSQVDLRRSLLIAFQGHHQLHRGTDTLKMGSVLSCPVHLAPALQNAEWHFYWHRMKAWPFRSEYGAPCLICRGQQLQLPPFANQNDSKLQPESEYWCCGARTTWPTIEEAAEGSSRAKKEAKTVCLESEVGHGDGRESRKYKYR